MGITSKNGSRMSSARDRGTLGLAIAQKCASTGPYIHFVPESEGYRPKVSAEMQPKGVEENAERKEERKGRSANLVGRRRKKGAREGEKVMRDFKVEER